MRCRRHPKTLMRGPLGDRVGMLISMGIWGEIIRTNLGALGVGRGRLLGRDLLVRDRIEEVVVVGGLRVDLGILHNDISIAYGLRCMN